MEVYNGSHLIITYEKGCSRLISTWKSSPPNDLEYRKELIEHLHIAQKIKPSQIIWRLDSLTLKVADDTKKWVNENISAPIFRAGFVGKNQDGFDQVAFIVGQDVLAYIEIMDIFKENLSIGFKPKYFATEIECINWLSQDANTKDSNSKEQKLSITFKGTDDDGKVVFEFKEQPSKFNSTINSFKTIIEQNHFIKSNVQQYSSLTPREIETLKFIIKGYTNLQISTKMYVSLNTIRTHRNRIWQKLEIKHFRDCLKYESFFN